MSQYILVPLTKSQHAIVDQEDAEFALSFKWYAEEPKPGAWYARRDLRRSENRGEGKVYLHRELLGVFDPAVFVDHRNRNGLDCRRFNIRRATPAENSRNTSHGRGANTYRGVTRCGSLWLAQISFGNKQIKIGRFATEDEALAARDEAAKELHGEFAVLNPRLAHGGR